jgi:hypothetical protein
MLSAALRVLNRPYTGSLKGAENVTRDDPQNADWVTEEEIAPCSIGLGMILTVQLMDVRIPELVLVGVISPLRSSSDC